MSSANNSVLSITSGAVADGCRSAGRLSGVLQSASETVVGRWLLQSLDPASSMLWLSTALVIGLLGGQWVWLSNQRPEPLLLIRAPTSSGFRLDVNRASWVEWVQLEGIGPNLANRIVADRRLRGPYRSLADLQRVSGIGPETLHRLGSSLTIRHEHFIAETDSSIR